jgi:para-aminobenzoate synthetase
MTVHADAGVCRKVFEEAPNIPVLGVCLGLQALAVAHGAVVDHAPYPVHGNLSDVTHSGHPLFQGIPSGE